ncbi:hypothetical protein EU527_19300 [Candidatus Thorarchaeota archaeon]|nr:MAG: hypothetical protein EU527_19300 [Candidatus Thorarchaeota archaeon]
MVFSDAKMILINPIGFFAQFAREERGKESTWFKGPILFLMTFLVVYCSAIPVWIMINNWILGISVWPILDFHYGNQVFLSIHKDWFHLIFSYTGDQLITWLLCIPIVYADTILTAIVFAFFIHLLFKHVFRGEGKYSDALAGICYGDLPSLLLGFLPFSAAVGLLWTGFLQFSATGHYLYRLSWNRALIPLILFGFTLVIGWTLFGTVSSSGLLVYIPLGPYGVP